MKLNREAMAHYLDTSWGMEAESAVWEIIGDDIEEMSTEMNPDRTSFKNILGQTKTTDNGPQPTMDADPFYADPEKKLYPKIRDLALSQAKGDECKTLMLEVLVEDTEATNHLAYVQEVSVVVQSYGGGTEGVNFPFQVMYDGARTKGYVTASTLSSGNPTFTAGEIPEEASLQKTQALSD